MNLLEKYKEVLDKISKNSKVGAIIIFGSYSTGKVKPLSDLDICIIPSKNCSKKMSETFLEYGSDELDISIFNDLPLPLQHKILEKGIIYHQKEDIRYLKLSIRRQYRDFVPYLIRAYKKRGYPITI